MLGVEFFPLLWVSHEDGTLEQRTKTARWNSVRLPTGLQGHQQSLGLLFLKKKLQGSKQVCPVYCVVLCWRWPRSARCRVQKPLASP